MSEEIKQLNIRLPAELHRKLKVKAIGEGMSLEYVIEELAKAYLADKVKIRRLK